MQYFQLHFPLQADIPKEALGKMSMIKVMDIITNLKKMHVVTAQLNLNMSWSLT